MANASAKNDFRFQLVTAGHHFLLNVLPFRTPDSLGALETFAAAVQRIDPPPADLESVLLRCLAVLQHHATYHFPTLVDRYLSSGFAGVDHMRRFSRCVDDLLRFHDIPDGAVQEAIQLIAHRYHDSTCHPQLLAQSVGLPLSTLDHKFHALTGSTLTEHIRDRRLEEAAILLVTTNKTIKEVWVTVGYNDHSNFDKQFRKRFQASPRQYRARALRPAAREVLESRQPAHAAAKAVTALEHGVRVLIVDDDEDTRSTVSWSLRENGHSVSTAATGTEGLEQAVRMSPDAVLLDYRMQDMDGLEVLRRLRRQPGGMVPAVALFTADWDLLDDAHAIAALDAMVASKLCDLDRVSDLVVYLTTKPPERLVADERSAWRSWIPFL